MFNWLPKIGYVPFWQDPIGNLAVTIWPAASVGYRYAAVATRMMRSSLLEVMREDYIRTARAKGVWTRLIMSRHALRNYFAASIGFGVITLAALFHFNQNPPGQPPAFPPLVGILIVVLGLIAFVGATYRYVKRTDEHDVMANLWGLSLGTAGRDVTTFFLGCVIVAGIFGAATASRKILYVQALPALVALGALRFS